MILFSILFQIKNHVEKCFHSPLPPPQLSYLILFICFSNYYDRKSKFIYLFIYFDFVFVVLLLSSTDTVCAQNENKTQKEKKKKTMMTKRRIETKRNKIKWYTLSTIWWPKHVLCVTGLEVDDHEYEIDQNAIYFCHTQSHSETQTDKYAQVNLESRRKIITNEMNDTHCLNRTHHNTATMCVYVFSRPIRRLICIWNLNVI